MCLVDAPHDDVGAQRSVGPDAGLLVEPRLLRHELHREEPVDLAPGVGHLGRDRVAEHLGDGAEQVVPDDGVLLGADAERHVLVRDAAHDVLERGCVGVDQLHGVGDD